MKQITNFNEKMTVILNPTVCSGDSAVESIQQIGIRVRMSGCHTVGQEICILLFGNIYNWKDFSLDDTTTPEDVIRKLYITYGIEYTLQLLDGVFSIILLDQRSELDQSTLYVTRDPIGLIPFYYVKTFNMYCISNKEDKMKNIKYDPEPGTYSTFTLSHKVISKWEKSIQNTTYSVLGKCGNLPLCCLQDIKKMYPSPPWPTDCQAESNTLYATRNYFYNVIEKYVDSAKHIICIIEPNNSESYLMADVIEYFYAWNGGTGKVVETICIVCDDEKNDYENTRYNHTNLHIEGNVSDQMKMKYLACSIRENIITEETVVLMGRGIHFLNNVDDEKDDFALRKKIKNIHNSLYSTIIEPFHNENLNVVFPLLDKSWVDFYLSIPPDIRSKDKTHFSPIQLNGSLTVLGRKTCGEENDYDSYHWSQDDDDDVCDFSDDDGVEPPASALVSRTAYISFIRSLPSNTKIKTSV